MAKVVCVYFTSNNEYSCKVSSQTISSYRLKVAGKYEHCKNNSDVERFIIDSCTFNKFPRNLHVIFPNLSELLIKNCRLESISRDNIGVLLGLRKLTIENCGLKYLQGDLLRDLNQLEEVSFRGNRLGEIDINILDGLQHLTYANFSRNATINVTFRGISNESGVSFVSLDALKDEIKLKCKPKGPQSVKCEFSIGSSGEYRLQVSAQIIVRPQLKFASDHSVFKDFKELCFENCTFEEFPKNLHELFPRLSTLGMQNCTLEEFNFEQVNEFINLHEFHFLNCNVKNINSAILMFKKNVEHEMKNSKKISKILCDDAFKDFTIYVGKISFKIHKILFAAHSATFAEIFKKNPEAVELNLQDIPEATFKIIYDFVYNEKLPENFTHWTELLAAANRLKIVDLVQIAADQLQHNITDANAQDVLELANKINNENLREAAFEHLIQKHFPNMTIKNELSRQPEKLKELIEKKLKLDREHKNLKKKMKNLKIEISQS